MELKSIFPVWEKLAPEQQKRLEESAGKRNVKKGEVLHRGSADCIGLLLVQQGQLRAYLMSDEGRQITIYRLFDLDICLFSASCMMSSIQFDVFIEAEKDTELRVLRYFQGEGMVQLSRGAVEITDPDRLARLCNE